ncbi:hypothetical protein EV175_006285 [Coemansia sp. RSA 1933]|nr:hypothetical protein EV175_006285 [Coemansia sp. RSA 1933]
MSGPVERESTMYRIPSANLVDCGFVFKRPFVDRDRDLNLVDSTVTLTISAYPAEPASGDWIQLMSTCLLFFALAMLAVACAYVAAKLVRIHPRQMALQDPSVVQVPTANSSSGARLEMAAATRGLGYGMDTIDSLIVTTSAMILELRAAADTQVSAFAPPSRTGKAVPGTEAASRREARGKIRISSLMGKRHPEIGRVKASPSCLSFASSYHSPPLPKPQLRGYLQVLRDTAKAVARENEGPPDGAGIQYGLQNSSAIPRCWP